MMVALTANTQREKDSGENLISSYQIHQTFHRLIALYSNFVGTQHS